MAELAKSEDQSIDKILASIRRIVADDDSEKLAQRPAEAASVELKPAAAKSADAAPATGTSYSPPPLESPATGIGTISASAKADHSSTVRDLTEPIASSASRSAAPTIDSSLAASPSAPIEHAAVNEAVSVTQSGSAQDERGRLMSSATSAAVDSAFNALAQTVLVDNARTLEELVREMLRPMLKVWLDDNLPGIVERRVRAEIERVSRGRSG
jgi:cell pole-organizing protein PopZ